jgi:serine phosphatase RsbU (regulator of sigma subunit)
MEPDFARLKLPQIVVLSISPSFYAMKLPFHSTAPQRTLRRPEPTIVPELETASISAQYRAARVGGDFYDFMVTDSGRLVFVLLDVAGKREEALDIAAAVQERMRPLAAELLGEGDINEAEGLPALLIELNRVIIQAAGGVRCAPAFLGCYYETLGTLAYINAGHTPALLKDHEGVTHLEANGFPLGLFSHATHDARFTAIPPGAALLLVSRGLVESKAGSKEYGIERLTEHVSKLSFEDAHHLCAQVLGAVKTFTESSWRHKETENDVTTLALVRAAARAAATVGDR